MAIDKVMADAMLTPFRNMIKECEEKHFSGAKFNELKLTFKRMETLATELDDINVFNAKCMEEALQMKMSQLYSELLSQEAKKSQCENNDYSDEALMKNTLKAYEDALIQLKNSLKNASYLEKNFLNDAETINTLSEIISLAKSGLTYPEFLTVLIKKGYDKALDGMSKERKGIQFEIDIAKETDIPPVIEMREKTLELFDTMAEKSPFNIPDALKFHIKRNELEWEYQPVINRWRAITEAFYQLFTLLYDWLDAYCDFAPFDGRWNFPGATRADVEKNIRRTKGTNPGFLKERLRIFNENFSLSWDNIFTHETFLFEYKRGFFPYSNERFELIKKTFQYCIPHEKPPIELIKQAEALHKAKKCANPQLKQSAENMKRIYNKYYGEGAYERSFGNK